MEPPATNRWKVFLQYVICAILIFLFSVWSYAGRPVDTSPDTKEYVAVAQNLSSEFAQDRSPGYPFLIRLSMIFGQNWPEVTVIIQSLMLSAMGLILMYIIQNLFGFTWVGALFALFLGFEPSMVHWANGILPETVLCFFVTLIWFISLSLLKVGDHLTRNKFVAAVAVGLLSGYAALVKPVWVFGFLPLVFAIILANFKRLKNGILLACIVAILHCVVILPWQIFLNNHFNQKFISRTGSINLNLVTLRAGMTEYCAGTPLYRYLEEKGLLGEAISLQWDDYAKFMQIKDAIPWETRDDASFYHAALSQQPQIYIRLLLNRWPKFLTSRPVSLQSDGGFPYLPNVFRYFYGGMYAWFFKLFLPFLLAAALFLAFKSSKLRPIILFSFSIFFYLSLLIVFTSYQDPLITRMRVSVEPIMLFLAALPLLSLGSSFATQNVRSIG